MKLTNSKKFKNKIHKLIPGGAHTYSKGDDQFPENSPSAFLKGRGSYIWDLDNNKYLDCSMGLSSVTLGHAYPQVINGVKRELKKGTNFQRPSIKELEIAELFLKQIKFHDRIKFSKNGSTATTAAVKLARAKTGRDLIAVPYDHPFYSYDDWFIGQTNCNKGIPKAIKDLTVTFKGCDIDSLEKLFKKYKNKIACVITEPERPVCNTVCDCKIPVKNFLKKAYNLTKKNGAMFILDEMITGYKSHFPGSSVKYNIEADLITWGKSISNGFSFSALTGKKKIMDLGSIKKRQEKVFLISTTHGAETHSIQAAIETLKIFKNKKIVEYKKSIGDYFLENIKDVIKENNLEKYIKTVDCNWFPQVVFYNRKLNVCDGLKTLIMQEMFKRKILFQGFLIPSFSHNKRDINQIAKSFDEVLKIYKKALKNGYKKYLYGEKIKPVFRKRI